MQVDHTGLDNERSSTLSFLSIVTPTSSVLSLPRRPSLHHRSRRGVALKMCNAGRTRQCEIDEGNENVKHGDWR